MAPSTQLFHDDPPSPLASAGLGRRRLRRLLRRRRRALGPRRRRANAIAVARRLATSDLLRRTRNVAVYLPRDGELDPLTLLTTLSSRNLQPWLPVIEPIPSRAPRLGFAPLDDPANMRPNRFGIPEPDRSRSRAGWTLDLVLLPLVGFDRHGGRLGMGGGFYDATFDPRRPRPARPKLVGLAHGVQEVDHLEMLEHDARLDAVVTERELILLEGAT
jgi:5-formyltetrahydrofolate cyclo-ligase